MGPGQLEMGSVLGRTLTIWARNFTPFAILTLVSFSPLVAYTLVLVVRPLDADAFSLWATIGGWAALPLGTLVAGAVVYGVAQGLRGRRAGVGPSISVGLRRMPTVLGATIALWILVAAAVVGVALVSLIVLASAKALLGGESAVFATVELALAAVTVGYITSVFWVTVPACVVEGRGIFASLKGSRRLTKGHRWKVLLIQGALLVLGLGGPWIVRRALLTEPLWPPSPPARLLAENDETSVKFYMFVSLALEALAGSVSAVASAVGYTELRASKERIEIENIAKAFD